MHKFQILLFLSIFTISCNLTDKQQSTTTKPIDKFQKDSNPEEIETTNTFQYKPEYIADSFDYPVGKPDAKGYYNAQAFGKNKHLGDDWNAVTGGNSDLGDPIYAIANGYVKFAENVGGGWGNVIRIIHQLPNGETYESLYAHCDEIQISAFSWIKKGQQIGTIGTADGQYYAHLHLEIRSDTELPIGGGYSNNQTGYLNPTSFIKKHRKVKE